VRVDKMMTAPADTLGYGRAMNETTVRNVPQVLNMPTDRVRWGPIWAGLLTTLTALLLLSLFGLAVGLSTINAGAATQGNVAADTGRNSAIWAGIAAIVAFLLGGYVAGRTAAVHERGWGALNGALVFLLAVPLLLWLVSQGLGGIMGNANAIAQGLHINLGQLQGAAGQAGQTAKNITPAQAQQAADAARNTAWGTLIGLLVALGASALGGHLGTRIRRPSTVTVAAR
jgi:hypothetical protein